MISPLTYSLWSKNLSEQLFHQKTKLDLIKQECYRSFSICIQVSFLFSVIFSSPNYLIPQKVFGFVGVVVVVVVADVNVRHLVIQPIELSNAIPVFWSFRFCLISLFVCIYKMQATVFPNSLWFIRLISLRLSDVSFSQQWLSRRTTNFDS